jgi:ADP-ribose pyrophosphatase
MTFVETFEDYCFEQTNQSLFGMKILGKEILSTSKYLNFVGIKFINKDNHEDTWYSAERPNGGKTVVIAALFNNKLVVTREFRVPIQDYEWALPAGLVDGEELPGETASRELKEETNLDLISVSNYTPYLYNTAGMTNEVVSMVYCHACGTINQSGNEKTEDIQCFLLDKAQLEELIKDNSKKFSAKAYLVFERFIKGDLW